MSPTFKHKNIFYDNHILCLNVNECKKYFSVGSTFSYYLIKKTDVQGETKVICEYNKKVYKTTCNLNTIKCRQYLPRFLTNVTLSILEKFMNEEVEKRISFKTSCELHNTTHKSKLNDHQIDDYIYPVRHTTKREFRYS